MENELGRKWMCNCGHAIEIEDINNSFSLPSWKRMHVHLQLNIQLFKHCIFCSLAFEIYFQLLNWEMLLYIFMVKSLTKIFREAFCLVAGCCFILLFSPWNSDITPIFMLLLLSAFLIFSLEFLSLLFSSEVKMYRSF